MRNEVENLSTVDHPGVIKLVKHKQNSTYIKKEGRGSYNCSYIVMEFCRNGSLFEIIAGTGNFPKNIVLYYFNQLIEAVNSCHLAGIAHRDIKPENILLDGDFNLKLGDFGYSIPLEGHDGSGIIYSDKGTISYMAPEIHRKLPYTGETVDFFSVGVVLFIMMNKNPPFRKADNSDQMYRIFCQKNELFWAMHSKGKPVGFYSSEFVSLMNKMLAPNPCNRPSFEEIKNHVWTKGEKASPIDILTEIEERRVRAVKNLGKKKRLNP